METNCEAHDVGLHLDRSWQGPFHYKRLHSSKANIYISLNNCKIWENWSCFWFVKQHVILTQLSFFYKLKLLYFRNCLKNDSVVLKAQYMGHPY